MALYVSDFTPEQIDRLSELNPGLRDAIAQYYRESQPEVTEEWLAGHTAHMAKIERLVHEAELILLREKLAAAKRFGRSFIEQHEIWAAAQHGELPDSFIGGQGIAYRTADCLRASA